MAKCIKAFFSVQHDKIFNVGDEISSVEFDSLASGYKENFSSETSVPAADSGEDVAKEEVVDTVSIAPAEPEAPDAE